VSRRQQRSGLRPMSEAMSDHFDRTERLYENPNLMPGIPTGFTDLDKMLSGFREEDLIILAARPGVGKTAFMLNLMANAGKARYNVAMFSLEMSESQLLNRMISAETAINSYKIRDGDLTEQEWRLYVEATNTIGTLPIFIDDTPNLKVTHIRQKCSYLRNLGKLDFVMVDHMQLIGGSAPDEERMRTVGDNSWELKMLAKELKVPVLVASQLSRAVEQRADKRPMLSDLSESDRIGQNADQIWFIYRPELYEESCDRPNEADIIVSKNRHGATGTVPLFFRKSLTQFANLTRLNINDLLEDAT
jgi:replicative DNA helicase